MNGVSSFKPSKPYLICIDSDGCAFDTMEIKHKECFCPAFIQAFSLQAMAGYARQAWEYTNLYSVSRGMHRFITLRMSLELLQRRREVVQRKLTIPDFENLSRWIECTPRLSNDQLEYASHDEPQDGILHRALLWSLDVNERVAQMVHGVPPFPYVREQLEYMHTYADIVVVSATQEAALMREWSEHGLDSYVDVVCGQETGGKRDIIRLFRQAYGHANVLMLGDAPGDRIAAHANGALFYPIRPGEEAESWEELTEFLKAMFSGANMEPLESAFGKRFDLCLPDTPPWESV